MTGNGKWWFVEIENAILTDPDYPFLYSETVNSTCSLSELTSLHYKGNNQFPTHKIFSRESSST